MEMENTLYSRFGLKNNLSDTGLTSSPEKEMLCSVVSLSISITNCLYEKRP